MEASFSSRPCAYCAESQPVLGDGHVSIHFLADGTRCRGSDARDGDGPVSEALARAIELKLRRVLNQLAHQRAS